MSGDAHDGLQPGPPGPQQFEHLLATYRQRVAHCQTENQINAIHIDFESHLTPAELRQFQAAFADEPGDLPERLWRWLRAVFAGTTGESRRRRWIESCIALLPVNRERPREFEKIGTSPHLTLYTNGKGSTARKTLLVGFTGNAMRLMLPPSVLLDCLNPDRYDVVILRDYSRRFYAGGIPGLGDTFFDAMSNLRNRVDPRRYRNAIALGTSGGALPAVLAAVLLQLDRGISIGGMSFETFGDMLLSHAIDSKRFQALMASRPAPYPDLLFACGAGHVHDSAIATEFMRLVPSRMLPVKDCDQHNVLAWLLKRGRLAAFLEEALGQSLEQPLA